MAGISLSGLASGLDWQTLVANLMTAERMPENTWKTQQSTNSSKISLITTINSDLTSLQTAAQALNNSAFGATSSTLSDTTIGTATSAPNTLTGQYNFQVNTLATTSDLLGASNVGAPISSSSNVSGVTVSTMSLTNPPTPGIFTVNGQQITVTSTESLQDVFAAIATATGNSVTARYNPASGSTGDTVTLTSSSPITLGSPADTSNILSALKLYGNGTGSVSSTAALGVVSPNSTIANANLAQAITNTDSSGNGTFSINGVSINYNVNTDTMQTLMARVNNSTAGVTMNYDNTTDQFSLTSNLTGSLGISVNETSGGLLSAMGLVSGSTFTAGINAQVQVNGGPVLTSNSNTFDQTVTGIKGLSLTAVATGSTNVTVATDTSNTSTLVNSFISAYNILQSFIGSQSSSTTDSTGAVTAGPLASDHDISDFSSSLQNMIFNAVPGLTGTIQSLDNIGIGFSNVDDILTVTDQSKLTAALQTNPTGVSALFNSTNGLTAQLNKFVTNVNDPTIGLVATETNSLNAQNSSLQDQINALETQVNNANTQMTNEYIAMESAISQIQTETQTLNAYFGTSTSSSSSSSSSTSKVG